MYQDIKRHYHWSNGKYGDEQRGGRIAVAVVADELRIEQLAGDAMPANMLPGLLAEIPEVVELANELHKTRKHPYGVEVRRGMSGCVDYKLRFLRDATINDTPVSACIHVSMYGKLNEPIRIWLGDLPPLWKAMAAESEFRVSEDVSGKIAWQFEEATQYEGDFRYPYQADEVLIIDERYGGVVFAGPHEDKNKTTWSSRT